MASHGTTWLGIGAGTLTAVGVFADAALNNGNFTGVLAQVAKQHPSAFAGGMMILGGAIPNLPKLFSKGPS